MVTGHTLVNPEDLLPGKGFSHVAVPLPGRLVFIAGQTAHDADGSIDDVSMPGQAAAALRNLATALAAAGAAPDHLISMQIFVTDVAAYRAALDPIGDAWREHLGAHYPAISLFGISELYDPDACIEIVATAVIPGPH